MNDVKMLLELDWKNLIIGITMFIVGFIGVRKLIIEFCNIIGYVTPQKREKEEIKKAMSVITEEVHQLKSEHETDHQASIDYRKKACDQQEEMLKALNELKNDIVQSNIDRMRYELLEFANQCRTMDRSKESYDHILEIYDKYNEILKKNNLENGRVDAAMTFIKNKYDAYLRDGFPF